MEINEFHITSWNYFIDCFFVILRQGNKYPTEFLQFRLQLHFFIDMFRRKNNP